MRIFILGKRCLVLRIMTWPSGPLQLSSNAKMGTRAKKREVDD
jgi:hypothetical protein